MSKKMICVAVAMAAVVCILLSLLTIKNNDGTEYYFLAQECKNYDNAGKLAVISRQRGGAGYIYEVGDKRYILLMGYENADVAEKIADNMTVDVEIIPIKINEANIDLSEKLLEGMISFEKDGNEKAVYECVLKVAKELSSQKSELYNLAMKTYGTSKENLGYATKYLYISLLLQK